VVEGVDLPAVVGRRELEAAIGRAGAFSRLGLEQATTVQDPVDRAQRRHRRRVRADLGQQPGADRDRPAIPPLRIQNFARSDNSVLASHAEPSRTVMRTPRARRQPRNALGIETPPVLVIRLSADTQLDAQGRHVHRSHANRSLTRQHRSQDRFH
jgi:hypothetical protein